MKKLFFLSFFASLVLLNSCKKKCYTCSEDCVNCNSVSGYSGKICKGDYEVVNGVSWETYKSALKAAGCFQDDNEAETCDETTNLVADGYVCTEKD